MTRRNPTPSDQRIEMPAAEKLYEDYLEEMARLREGHDDQIQHERNILTLDDMYFFAETVQTAYSFAPDEVRGMNLGVVVYASIPPARGAAMVGDPGFDLAASRFDCDSVFLRTGKPSASRKHRQKAEIDFSYWGDHFDNNVVKVRMTTTGKPQDTKWNRSALESAGWIPFLGSYRRRVRKTNPREYMPPDSFAHSLGLVPCISNSHLDFGTYLRQAHIDVGIRRCWSCGSIVAHPSAVDHDWADGEGRFDCETTSGLHEVERPAEPHRKGRRARRSLFVVGQRVMLIGQNEQGQPELHEARGVVETVEDGGTYEVRWTHPGGEVMTGIHPEHDLVDEDTAWDDGGQPAQNPATAGPIENPASDVNVMLERTPPIEDLMTLVEHHGGGFSQDEVEMFINYCIAAVESAPEVEYSEAARDELFAKRRSGSLREARASIVTSADIGTWWGKHGTDSEISARCFLTLKNLTIGVDNVNRSPSFVPATTTAPKIFDDVSLDAWRSAPGWVEKKLVETYFVFRGETHPREHVPTENPASAVTAMLNTSPDISYLMDEVAALSPQGGSDPSSLVFSRQEVEAFVNYCIAAVEAAPEVPEDVGITKEMALSLRYGQELFHRTEKDSRGNPMKCRVTGKVKTWKGLSPAKKRRIELGQASMEPRDHDAGDFRIPVKRGMYQAFYVEKTKASSGDVFGIGYGGNYSEWCLSEKDALLRTVTAKDVTCFWQRHRNDGVRQNNAVRLRLKNLEIAVIDRPEIHVHDQVQRASTTACVMQPDALDEWRAAPGWRERSVGPNNTQVAFDFHDVEPPWWLNHSGDCRYSLTQRCDCGAFP